MPRRSLPLPRSIFIDVDGTLMKNGKPNRALIAWLRKRKAEGFELVLWSNRGVDHARDVARRFFCADLFSAIITKPGLMIDDLGKDWLRAVPAKRNF